MMGITNLTSLAETVHQQRHPALFQPRINPFHRSQVSFNLWPVEYGARLSLKCCIVVVGVALKADERNSPPHFHFPFYGGQVKEE